MSLGTTDIFLLVILVSSLIVGFFWGAARSLMMLAAWLLALLAGAYLQLNVGSYLSSQWTNFDSAFNEMAAFGIIYFAILIAAPVVVFVMARGNQRISRWQVLDDTVGAVFAVFVAFLSIAGIMMILSTYYEPEGIFVPPKVGPEWTAQLYQSLLGSNIGAGINERLIPIISTVLGPLLPAAIREALV